MSFHEIERGEFKGRAPLKNIVQVHTNGTAALSFAIAGDIAKKIGDPIFINILLGSGEHSGYVAFIPRNVRGPASYKVCRQASRPTARFSIHPKKLGVVARKIAPTILPHEITEDGLIVDIRPLRQPSLSAAA